MKNLFAILVALTLSLPVYADEVDVLMVKAMQHDGMWQFNITVHHPDSGNDHMVDSIAIFTPDGTEITTIAVPTPHVGAEHVTIMITDIPLAQGTEYIMIRGHCNKDGWAHEGVMIYLG